MPQPRPALEPATALKPEREPEVNRGGSNNRGSNANRNQGRNNNQASGRSQPTHRSHANQHRSHSRGHYSGYRDRYDDHLGISLIFGSYSSGVYCPPPPPVCESQVIVYEEPIVIESYPDPVVEEVESIVIPEPQYDPSLFDPDARIEPIVPGAEGVEPQDIYHYDPSAYGQPLVIEPVVVQPPLTRVESVIVEQRTTWCGSYFCSHSYCRRWHGHSSWYDRHPHHRPYWSSSLFFSRGHHPGFGRYWSERYYRHVPCGSRSRTSVGLGLYFRF